jgi:uncharacterized protein (DUF2252 family)
MKESRPTRPENRKKQLACRRLAKMASSCHGYMRGNIGQFYDWLDGIKSVPRGPDIWICGDCHVGNFGPLADAQGDIQIQIRDFDHGVIGNPSHDIIRLCLSLATSARGSDLPGVITVRMIENLILGYSLALESHPDRTKLRSGFMKSSLQSAKRRSFKKLAQERIKNTKPSIPLGRRFWPLSHGEREQLAAIFEDPKVTKLVTALRKREGDTRVRFHDAAYWVKGCDSLGRLRYAVLMGVDEEPKDSGGLCLMDIKEATAAIVPRTRPTPRNDAERVVRAAQRLSPYLGERMLPIRVRGKPAFLRELLPQDLKLEINKLEAEEGPNAAGHLGHVLGMAHARQMDRAVKAEWCRTVSKRSKTLRAPNWLWDSVKELHARFEADYLEHCRRNPELNN